MLKKLLWSCVSSARLFLAFSHSILLLARAIQADFSCSKTWKNLATVFGYVSCLRCLKFHVESFEAAKGLEENL